MNTYTWALDISLSCTGISIFNEQNNIEHICSVKTRDKNTRGERLYEIYNQIVLLKEKYPPNIIIIEKGFDRFHNEGHAIQNAVGVILMTLKEVEPIYYMPKTIKATILSGNASKQQLRKAIELAYPDLRFSNNDESDSYCIAMTYFIKEKILKWDKNKYVIALAIQSKPKKVKKNNGTNN